MVVWSYVIYVAKWFMWLSGFMWLNGLMWLSGFMWLKVAKSG